MKPKTRIILLSIISILIVVTIVLGVTYSFMKADIESSSVTEVSLKSCAKITLKDTDVSINLNNAYPMSKNKALQTTPYTFTVSSSCENYVGFNLYLATLNTNTLDASNIHYIITSNGSKDILAEGILSNATNAESEFSNEEKAQLNSGINGTYGSIYKLYNASIPLQGEKSYDLYLYVDESVTDASTMNKSFKAGIAVKSYDRELTFAEYIIENVYVSDGENGLYYHDGIGTYTNADQEAGDNSYRYSGANPNNYVCFGSDAETCPNDNLYRIIGVFDLEVKLIKSTSYGTYQWNSSDNNTWDNSIMRNALNTTYYNSLSATWKNKITTHVWEVGGMTDSGNTVKQYYDREVGNSSSSITDNMKVGLMYVSDFGYASIPDHWKTPLDNYESSGSNWMAELVEWTISRDSGSPGKSYFISINFIGFSGIVNVSLDVRPSFYLTSSVTYVSGSGTSADPFRII